MKIIKIIKNSIFKNKKTTSGFASSVLVILGFLIIGLAAALKLMPQRQEIRKRAINYPTSVPPPIEPTETEPSPVPLSTPTPTPCPSECLSPETRQDAIKTYCEANSTVRCPAGTWANLSCHSANINNQCIWTAFGADCHFPYCTGCACLSATPTPTPTPTAGSRTCAEIARAGGYNEYGCISSPDVVTLGCGNPEDSERQDKCFFDFHSTSSDDCTGATPLCGYLKSIRCIDSNTGKCEQNICSTTAGCTLPTPTPTPTLTLITCEQIAHGDIGRVNDFHMCSSDGTSQPTFSCGSRDDPSRKGFCYYNLHVTSSGDCIGQTPYCRYYNRVSCADATGLCVQSACTANGCTLVSPTETPTPTPSLSPSITSNTIIIEFVDSFPPATQPPAATNTPIPPSPTPTSGQPMPTVTITPTINPNSPLLKLKINFFGVWSEPNNPASLDYKNQTAKVSLKNNLPTPTIVFTKGDVNFRATTTSGGFNYENPENVATNVPTGTYHLLIKGPKHLQRRYKNLNLVAGLQTLDFSSIENSLPGGDLPLPQNNDFNNLVQDGKVNSQDYAFIVNNFNKTETNILTVADLNLDGIINTGDTAVLAATLAEKLDEDE